jgi:nuclear pore complex protein Nup160
MCEENAVEKLITFNFAAFADEVEDALSFKARNVDPRLRPCYSRILYTWYVFRGDYRNGKLCPSIQDFSLMVNS